MSEQPNPATADPRVTVAPTATESPLVSVSRYQIPDFNTPLYRVQSAKGATTEIKPSKVIALVAEALGISKRTRAAKSTGVAPSKPKK